MQTEELTLKFWEEGSIFRNLRIRIYSHAQDKVFIIRVQTLMAQREYLGRYIFCIISITRVIIIINVLIQKQVIIIIVIMLYKLLTSLLPMQWNTRIKHPYNENRVHKSHLTSCLINNKNNKNTKVYLEFTSRHCNNSGVFITVGDC